MDYDLTKLKYYLKQHLQAKLLQYIQIGNNTIITEMLKKELHFDPKQNEAMNPSLSKNSEIIRDETLDVIRHNIYRLRDRLTHHIYGPHSEALTDEFINKYNLPVRKYTPDYYTVMQKVLKTEIEFYSILESYASQI